MDLRQLGYSGAANTQQASSGFPSNASRKPVAPLFSLARRVQTSGTSPNVLIGKVTPAKIFSFPTRGQRFPHHGDASQGSGSSHEDRDSSLQRHHDATRYAQSSPEQPTKESTNANQLQNQLQLSNPTDYLGVGSASDGSMSPGGPFQPKAAISESGDERPLRHTSAAFDAHISTSPTLNSNFLHMPPPLDTRHVHRSRSRSASRSATTSHLAHTPMGLMHDKDDEAFRELQGLHDRLSQLQVAKTELSLKTKEAADLGQRLQAVTAEYSQANADHQDEIAKLKRSYEQQDAQHQERLEAEIEAVKSQARSDNDAAMAQVAQARDEVSNMKTIAEMQNLQAQEELKTVKDKVDAIQQVNKKLVDMNRRRQTEDQTSLADLARQNQNLQRILREASTEARESTKLARDGLELVQSLVDGGSKMQETRVLISELQEDRNNSQQVNKILRDKLNDAMGDLAEARERIKDLETKQLQEADTLKRTTHEIGDLSHRLSDMLKTVKTREREEIDALAEAHRFEEKFRDAQIRNDGLQGKLDDTSKRLEETDLELRSTESALRSIKERYEEVNQKLASTVEIERNTSAKLASSLLQVHQLALRADSADAALARANEEHDRSQSALDATILKTKAEIKSLHDAIRQHEIRERSENVKQEQTKSQLAEVQKVYDATKSALEGTTQTLHNANARFMTLERRFEDQTLLLSMSREERGEINERLIAAERAHAEQLGIVEKDNLEKIKALEKLLHEDSKAFEKCHAEQMSSLQTEFAERLDSQKQAHNERLRAIEREHTEEFALRTKTLEVEIAVLKEQKANLEQKLTATVQDLQRQQEAFVGASVDYERKLSNQEALLRKVADAQESRADNAEQRATILERQVEGAEVQVSDLNQKLEAAEVKVQDATRSVSEVTKASTLLRDQVDKLTTALHSAQERAEAMEAPSAEYGDRIKGLQLRIAGLDETIAGLKHKASTLSERYKEAKLDEDEKAFVDSLLNLFNDLHEQQLVDKDNELRRARQKLVSHQSMISKLESKLARKLRTAPAQEDVVQDTDTGGSMINLQSWVHPSSDAGNTMNKGSEVLGEASVGVDATHARTSSPALAEAAISDSLINTTMVAVSDEPLNEPSSKTRNSPPQDTSSGKAKDILETPVVVSPRLETASPMPQKRRTFMQLAESDLSEIEDASDIDEYHPTKQAPKKRRTVAPVEPIVNAEPFTPVPKPELKRYTRRSGANRKSDPAATVAKKAVAGPAKGKNRKR
ncbi:hypothetical protein HGRIS_011443 [Hohenbuehelia grisea]|uniref:Uncharacterized protein n=1 Tax=Hohenbuehelia grisea TaxID=104357 RepID=A0ABR3JWU8_9AGAR